MIEKYINQNRFTLDHIQNRKNVFFVDKRKSLNPKPFKVYPSQLDHKRKVIKRSKNLQLLNSFV